MVFDNCTKFFRPGNEDVPTSSAGFLFILVNEQNEVDESSYIDIKLAKLPKQEGKLTELEMSFVKGTNESAYIRVTDDFDEVKLSGAPNYISIPLDSNVLGRAIYGDFVRDKDGHQAISCDFFNTLVDGASKEDIIVPVENGFNVSKEVSFTTIPLEIIETMEVSEPFITDK